MNTSHTIPKSLVTVFTPLLLRLQQIKSIRIQWDDNYRLPESELDIEKIKKETLSFPSKEVLLVLEHIMDELEDSHKYIINIQESLEPNKTDPLEVSENGNSPVDNAVEELLAYVTEIDTLYKLHKTIFNLREETNENQIDNGKAKYLTHPKPTETRKLIFDKYQSALFFSYLEEARIIQPHSNTSLATILHILTGYSEQNLRTKDGLGDLDGIKTDKKKSQKNVEKHHNLKTIKQGLNIILNLIDKEIERQERPNTRK